LWKTLVLTLSWWILQQLTKASSSLILAICNLP
jgi:hypothetical protein